MKNKVQMRLLLAMLIFCSGMSLAQNTHLSGLQLLLLCETDSPALSNFGPEPSFIRVGAVSASTIPTALMISLTRATEEEAFVSVVSDDPTSLLVTGGGVTIPIGSSSAPVLVSGIQQAQSTTLTASFGGSELDVVVRVVGPAENPAVLRLDPLTADVEPLGSVPMEVVLDIPAGVAGNTIDLSAVPGTFGSVPANVLVPEDKISAPFDFTANAGEGIETITASLNTSMAQATITVKEGG